MRPWLDGDLAGLDVRADLPRLRDAALSAAHRGEDLRPLYRAIAEIDPVACAELAAGPRAVAHPVAVTGALAAADTLEQVIAPSGLYARLLELAPTLAGPVLVHVAHRHLEAAWVVPLFRRSDPAKGALHLEVAALLGRLEAVSRSYGQAGGSTALVTYASATGSVEPLAALWRAGRFPEAVEAGAAALSADPSAPVVEAAAALAGPDVRVFVEALLARVDGAAASEVRRVLAVGPLPVR
ncbi:MAG: hypothetical protein ACI8PZ_000665 [Myxococcota bacterium]|jgi:hypothetical protein